MTLLLSQHQTFEHLEEMNEAVRIHLNENRNNLNQTAIKVLEIISRHAVKYTGAAWLKIETLAKLLEKSPATTRRAISLLERLNIIQRVSFMRKKRGGNGGNILLILPPKPIDDCPQVIARQNPSELRATSTEVSNSKKETTYSLKQNNNNTNDTALSLKHGLVAKLPAVIANTLAPFFNEAELYTAYGVILRAKSSVDRTIAFEHYEYEYRNTILSVINAYKRGKVRNLMGVLYHAIKQITKSLYIRQLSEEVFSF